LKHRGKWLRHTIMEPGIVEHEAENGDKVYTLCCTTYSSLSILNIREICELADKHCSGELNFTTSNNIEFIADSLEKIEELKADLASRKFKNGACKFPLRVLTPALVKFKTSHFA
jgi:sulfite reductase beta subunit